ncbi:hypothetical protein BU14_0075s0005 [Porphyra umbilicalis]|uniref:Uncharacterized protein n=1 Tax=Porphyra umbilicalis TaxID=2786 RepID=A0A1X6PF80_PORUM|nr:hypothetical protein BU14_0075s0005 [Porphyra umbilicalis]|eukprot:OSX79514.1 hypothetical protein BU14_0075s0005 [Porphyra umbilicalis]
MRGSAIGGVPLLAAPPVILPSSVGVVKDSGGGSAAPVPPLVAGAAVGASLASGNGPPKVRHTLPPLGSPPTSTGGPGAPRRPTAPPFPPTPPSTASAVVAATEPAVGAKATGDAAGDGTAAYGKTIGGLPPLVASPVSSLSSLEVIEDGGGCTAGRAPPSAAGAAVRATRAVGSGPRKARHTPPPLGSPPASTGGPGGLRRPSPSPTAPPPPKTKGIGAPAPRAAVGGE